MIRIKIQEIINDYRKSQVIQFNQVSSTNAKCPCCNEEFYKNEVVNNKLEGTVWENIDGKGHIYNDGDMIPDIEKGIKLKCNQYDSMLYQGSCRKCHQQYNGISIYMTNKPTNEEYFVVDDDGILYEEQVNNKLYSIEIDKKNIGALILYKNVNIKGDFYNVYEIRIDGLFNEMDLRGEEGICYCHSNKSQYNIWQSAKMLSQIVINELVEKSEFKITI